MAEQEEKKDYLMNENKVGENEEQTRFVTPAERAKMFEFYWNNGEVRSYVRVSQEFSRSEPTINKIAQEEEWQNKIARLKEKTEELLDKKLLESWGLSKKERMQIARAAALIFAQQLKGEPVLDKDGRAVYEIETYIENGETKSRIKQDPATGLPIPLLLHKDISPSDYISMWKIIKTELDEASDISTSRVDFSKVKEQLNLTDEDFSNENVGRTITKITELLATGTGVGEAGEA
jgi:hypothetical protein